MRSAIVLSSFMGLTAAQDQATVTSGGNANCGTLRTRKHWQAHTQQERELYLGAVSKAMENGTFQAFAGIHTEDQSKKEAHDTCGFVLWHRKFLLGYENMLRSMGDEYKCVTIPYWDSMDEFKDQYDGKCSNIAECSPIVSGIGGAPTKEESRNFNGHSQKGVCYKGAPFEGYCDANNQCGMVRGDVSKVQIASGHSYISLFNLITENKNYAAFNNALRTGVHNKMHSDMGGYMATMASPVDPLFYSWHATVDMLHYVWKLCHVDGTEFNNCDGMTGQSTITMKIKDKDGTMNVEDHETIGNYFKDMGTAYYEFQDSQSLGDYAYGFDFPADFRRHMLSDKELCPNAVPEPVNEVPPEDGSSDEDDDGYFAWYKKTKAELEKKYPNDPEEVELQLNYLECINFNDKFGVTEISEEFRQNVLNGQVERTRCEEILNKIEAKEISVEEEIAEKVEWAPNATEAIDAEFKRQKREKFEGLLKTSTATRGAQYATVITVSTTLIATVLAYST